MPKATRKSTAAAPVRPTLYTYFVLDPNVQHLGGSAVREIEGQRAVLMTAAEAQYWLDQGRISIKPISALSAEEVAAHRQMGRRLG